MRRPLQSSLRDCQKMFLLIVIVLVWLLYKWSVSNYDYFEKIGVGSKKPVPLVGNMLPILLAKESMLDMTRESYRKFKKEK